MIDKVHMETTTVSPKYQVVIPQKVRDAMKVKPGQRFYVLPYGNRIEFIPQKDIKKMRGFLKGMDTTLEREDDRL